MQKKCEYGFFIGCLRSLFFTFHFPFSSVFIGCSWLQSVSPVSHCTHCSVSVSVLAIMASLQFTPFVSIVFLAMSGLLHAAAASSSIKYSPWVRGPMDAAFRHHFLHVPFSPCPKQVCAGVPWLPVRVWCGRPALPQWDAVCVSYG